MSAARSDLAERHGDAIERAMIGSAVRVLDRRAAALRARDGDASTRALCARVAEALEDAAGDVQALMGPLVPVQGALPLLVREAS